MLQGMAEPTLHRGPVTYISQTCFAALRLHRRVSSLMAIGCVPWSSQWWHQRPTNRCTTLRYILSCYISSTSFHQLWELSANLDLSALLVSSIHFQMKKSTIQFFCPCLPAAKHSKWEGLLNHSFWYVSLTWDAYVRHRCRALCPM